MVLLSTAIKGVAVAGFELREPIHATTIPIAAFDSRGDDRRTRHRNRINPTLHAGASKSKSSDNIISLN